MPFHSSTNDRNRLLTGLWFAFIAVLIPYQSFAQNKVIGTYTLPDTPIKAFQNAVLPGSVANDRKILLGSVGSDLWHGANDPQDEFWMITDRGPNGQIKVAGSNRRTFWVPEFNPMILRIKTDNNAINIVQTIPIVDQSGKPVSGLPNVKGTMKRLMSTRARRFYPST